MAIDIGIDMGSYSTQIYVANKGLVVSEPTIVVADENKQIRAIGREALEMTGKTAEGLSVIHPMRSGAVNSFNYSVEFLKILLDRCSRTVFAKRRVAMCVPSELSEVEKRAVEETAISAGAKEVYLIESPLAGAIGAGIEVSEPKGYVILDVGAGTTEAAVVSLGGVVVSSSSKTAGDAVDQAIVQFVKKKFNVEISDLAAERVKIKIGAALRGTGTEIAEVQGKDMYSGAAKAAILGTGEVYGAIGDVVKEIVETVVNVLEKTPPELAADIIETGIIMIGEGSRLKGLGRLVKNVTGVEVYMAERPVESAAFGAALALKDKNKKLRLLSQVTAPKNY